MKQTASILLLILMAISVFTSGCGIGQATVSGIEDIEAATPIPVEVTSPLRANVFATHKVTATIRSDADAPVIAKAEGEVVELLVEEGDYVSEGQVLARLDGERSRLELLAARAELVRARKEYQRNVDLHDRGLVSTSMFEGLEYDLAALEASFQVHKLDYEYRNIRATISGVVAAREIKLGQTLAVNDVTFRITDTTELIAYLHIPQAELHKFKAGQKATLSVAATPDASYSAVISRISPTIDTRNGTFRATATVDSTGGELAPGMFGRFTVAYEEHADALLIPLAALIDEDEQATVYVVSGAEVARRAVTTGIETDGRVEILNGLDEHDTIVVTGHASLRDGSRVLASGASQADLTG
ncbi:MAG: efflux RND transporter periplasmic adaptor subunit [Gammaproteobacteria bacterium]|nr:efflux RND transporter periplasmic adaptor subunit [Gammaproteobacteria bacterium]MBU2675481.1 efflux RND transporter periplasmic adaptor subunit [Gammaproteobacteria bacterium]NNL49216.1 efflux RND transporter periplasmic adaptor subunit [Woeseiaceae bacterium]